MESSQEKAQADEILKEFPPMGRYRIRLVKRGRKNLTVLDIREYLSAETFTGFTRKGITLASRSDLETLSKALAEILAADLVK